MIPKAIKEAMLMAYINKCRELYQIAFFQYRILYPSELKTNIDELEELVDFRIEYTYERSKQDLTFKLNPKTLKSSKVRKDLIEIYS